MASLAPRGGQLRSVTDNGWALVAELEGDGSTVGWDSRSDFDQFVVDFGDRV